jgi:hypothetical protein
MEYWMQVLPMEGRGLFFMGVNGVTWLSEWCDFWATSCHSLWCWRNKQLHDDNFERPFWPIQHVLKKTGDYMQALQNSNTVETRNKTIVMIRWLPPKDNFVKLNTDGACKDQSVVGCSGIVCGSQGEWIGGFAKCVGSCSAFVAEI